MREHMLTQFSTAYLPRPGVCRRAFGTAPNPADAAWYPSLREDHTEVAHMDQDHSTDERRKTCE